MGVIDKQVFGFFYLQAQDIGRRVKLPGASIAEKLTYKEVGWCKNIPVEISNLNSNLDFVKSSNSGLKEPCINADFFQGKKWMLDYKRRRLLILDSE